VKRLQHDSHFGNRPILGIGGCELALLEFPASAGMCRFHIGKLSFCGAANYSRYFVCFQYLKMRVHFGTEIVTKRDGLPSQSRSR